MNKRKSGVLLHITSLPGPFGIGDLGKEAYKFADFLVGTHQSLWQILPLGHTSYGNSPYMCISAFGGNPYLISPEKLYEDGLLDKIQIQNHPKLSKEKIDYGKVIPYKIDLLRKSFEKFKKLNDNSIQKDFHNFIEQNNYWIEDYSLFTSIKYANSQKKWTQWKDKNAALRKEASLKKWRKKLAYEIEFWKFVQYQFSKQWKALKSYCNSKGIKIIGDMPIYVAHDSAEVWSHRELFHLDKDGEPKVIAGVPPDYFSETGQRWGNPIYRWNLMADRKYKWWIERFKSDLTQVDIIRLDHFRGFEAYWQIPASEPTAVKGKWIKGPGKEFFKTIKKALGNFQIIAEDLGVITPEVDRLRDELAFPGMRVLQWAFGNDPKSPEYIPHRHIRNCIAYTGGHDNDTVLGWFNAKNVNTTQSETEANKERQKALKYLGTDGLNINWDFIRLALSSVADTAICPLQDILSLGSDARMNIPATSSGNWEWRFCENMLTKEIKRKLKELTDIYDRAPNSS